jgi:hypothetical protein
MSLQADGLVGFQSPSTRAVPPQSILSIMFIQNRVPQIVPRCPPGGHNTEKKTTGTLDTPISEQSH